MQVREVLLRTGRAVERLRREERVGGELHEVARDEARGEAVLPQQRHQQPGAVPARADGPRQRGVGGLDPGLHAHRVLDVTVDRRVQADQEVDDRHPVLRQLRQIGAPARHDRSGNAAGRLGDRSEVRGQVGPQPGLVLEREPLGVLLDEEVERVDHREVGDEPHRDVEMVDRLREHESRQPVPERVLLPVHEVASRLDPHRVRLDRGARVRRRPQAHHVRTQSDPTVERVRRAVLEPDLDRHVSTLHDARYRRVSGEDRQCRAEPPVGRVGASSVSARIETRSADRSLRHQPVPRAPAPDRVSIRPPRSTASHSTSGRAA